MASNTKNPLFYSDKPLFGLDIGHGSLKVMEMSDSGDKRLQLKLKGYGTTSFDGSIIKDGVITKPEIIAAALQDLFENKLIGDISTRRVAMTIPTYRTFTRSISLPKLKPKDLKQAVETEAERYIPLNLAELYLDYEVISESNDNLDILAVAIPRKIVDSYLDLCRLVNLEPVLIETTMHAANHILTRDKHGDIPSMVIDFGSLSCDVSLERNQKILVMGTVNGGGESFSRSIEKALNVSYEAAGIIKNKYGLGASKKQKEIVSALTPTLQPLIKEIRRMLRYYSDRFTAEKAIEQIIILGGGANMPGLSDYLTNNLRLPSRTLNPWYYFDYGHLEPPAEDDKTMYATVAGLSLVNPKKVFA